MESLLYGDLTSHTKSVNIFIICVGSKDSVVNASNTMIFKRIIFFMYVFLLVIETVINAGS